VKRRLRSRVFAQGRGKGFSLVEMVVSLAVLLILSAIAIPTLMRAYRSYLLSDAAARVAGVMKFTRFEAIRKNTVVGFQVKQTGANWLLWTDSNGNGIADPTEPEVVVTNPVTMLGSGSVPGPATIVAALGSASPGLTVLSGTNTLVSFDGRGAVSFSGSAAVYVFYLGNPNISDMGARAVVLLPSGIVQTWTASNASAWVRVS